MGLLGPRPGALVVRRVFERQAARVTKALEKHAPSGVDSITDQQYRPGDSDAFLDVHVPASDERPRPTVVWTHGGAWISGSRSSYRPYFELLASRGFTVVSLDYSLGPRRHYPAAVQQIDDAHAYLLAHADRLQIDPTTIFLAGDSAGAQLTSQLATAVTDPAYADLLGIVPSLRPEQLHGVILNCGIYDVPAMAGGSGVIGWGVHQSLWAWTGLRDYATSPAAELMSTLNHVTHAFPPTYISGGNADPLTEAQSKPLAERLAGLGVDVTTLFYPTDHAPALEHEYQFDLDNPDGIAAFESTVTFLRAHLGS